MTFTPLPSIDLLAGGPRGAGSRRMGDAKGLEHSMDRLAEHRIGEQGSAPGSHGQTAWPQAVGDIELINPWYRAKLGTVIGGQWPKSDANLRQRPGGETWRHGEPGVEHLGHTLSRQAMVKAGVGLAAGADDDARILEGQEIIARERQQ